MEGNRIKLLHFNTLQPLCPCCRLSGNISFLKIQTIEKQQQDTIIEGILSCPESKCLSEYPIIDGIPVIVSDLRAYVSQYLFSIIKRSNLSGTIESLIGDCCGQGSFFDSERQNLSTYGFSHYGDLDPKATKDTHSETGSAVNLLQEGMGKLNEKIQDPVIDIGCAVGRTSFELAKVCNGIVLGVDLNFSMLKTATEIMQTGLVSYPKRRVGIVYEDTKYPVNFPNLANVDFWVCDALALPFSDSTFSFAMSFNVLDCVNSPYEHLKEIARLLKENSKAMISSPYDWSVNATPVESWIGGHSQRGETLGQSELILKSLLKGGGHQNALEQLEIVSETEDFPWQLRIHDRSTMNYSVHMVLVKKWK